jgi:hypothetical protein
MVEADLASGALVQIATEDVPAAGRLMVMSAIYRTDSPPGPAARWFIDYLKQNIQRSKEKTAIVSVLKASTAKRQRSANRRSLAKTQKRSRRR